MCGAAEDGQILIDAMAAAEIGDAFAVIPLGTRPLRGFHDPIAVFSIDPSQAGLVPTLAAPIAKFSPGTD
jgi:class 3 adenylate cyclase